MSEDAPDTQPNEHTMLPHEVQAMRAEYEAQHGEYDFQPDGTPHPLPPQLITGMPKHLETPAMHPPREPYVEPEIERERPLPKVIDPQPPQEPKA